MSQPGLRPTASSVRTWAVVLKASQPLRGGAFDIRDHVIPIPRFGLPETRAVRRNFSDERGQYSLLFAELSGPAINAALFTKPLGRIKGKS
jgi:hypothetical protein